MTNDLLNRIEAIQRTAIRELWIVTAAHDHRRGGLLATWVNSASIDREHPVMLISLAVNHFTTELVQTSGSFGLHLISQANIDLAWNFACGSGRERDKLANIQHSISPTGTPILEDCLTWLDCRVFFQKKTGDRIFFWGDVVGAGELRPDAPLTDLDLFRAANPEQKRQLMENRQADIELLRPHYLIWREAIQANK